MVQVFLLLSLLLSPKGDEASLNACREAYFQVNSEKDVENLLRLLEYVGQENPSAMAYKGAATAMQADYALNPYKKWTYFNEGKDLIEEAAKRDINNAEIRFLRLGVQLFTPSFLDYSDNVEEDTQLICTALEKDWMKEQRPFREQIIDFMLEYAPVSNLQRNALELSR